MKSTWKFALTLIFLSIPMKATDGMNLEGYGPISTALGGTSMAYDNGLAGLMNNPATLMFMRSNEPRLDFSITQLGPSVSSTAHTPYGSFRANSASDAFYMPAIGWGTTKGKLSYGFGIFAQGGMGCEYSADSWMGRPWQGLADYDLSLTNRSEVSVGRAMGGIAYRLTDRLTIGASLDFVWAGLDLQMGMSQAQFMDMANPMAQNGGYANGSLLNTFTQMYEPFGGMGVQELNYAYFDFSDGSDYTGQAKGEGYAAKLGILYEISDKVTMGATIHTQTKINDLKTGSATMSMGLSMDTGIMMGQMPSGEYVDIIMPVSGHMAVRDFQWPLTSAIGIAWKPNQNWLVAFDIKHLQWSKVMESFDMTFTADKVPENGMLAGQELNAGLYQNWDDQTVYAIGAAYAFRSGITLRTGANITNNPIPDNYINPLFPAIIEEHAMIGLGYDIGHGELNLVGVKSFENEGTSPGNGTTIPAVTSSHEQFNWSLQYTFKF